jgi:hypothetical protein
MRLYSSILARNEADPTRYLRRVLSRCREFSDAVLVLDDRSTDLTPKIAKEYGAVVRQRSVLDARAWGNEASARKELWDFALEYATGPNDWLLVVDADMEFVGDPRDLCNTKELNSWAVILYDLWDSDTTYRSDDFWVGHTVPRVWLVAPRRVPSGWQADWSSRGIHTGHLPQNWVAIAGIAPPDTYHYLHLGWQKPEHRQLKYREYKAQSHQLSAHELAHVESIIA